MRDLLEELGHEVVEAANGQEAFDFLIAHPRLPIKLIVLDLKMPVMNGWEFLALMRSYLRLSRIPIVVVSGNVSSLLPEETEAVAGCLQVPYDVSKLRAMVDAVAAS